MAKMRGAIVVDIERCKGWEQTDWEKCNGCTSCAIVCPDGCITVYRKKEESDGQ